MSKISVVYWSQSGNTAAMAEAVAKGVTDAGKGSRNRIRKQCFNR